MTAKAGTLRNATAILYSDESRSVYAGQAQELAETYTFTAAAGNTRTWLKGEYAYLAPNALSSILHRWEISHDLIDEQRLDADGLDAYTTLFIPNAGHLRDADITRITDWLLRPDRFLPIWNVTS